MGSRGRVRVVERTNGVITRARRVLGSTVVPKVSALRLSGVTRRGVEGCGTVPSFGKCNNFPNSVYTSVGRRMMRKVPKGGVLGRNSVMDLSMKTCCGKCRSSSTGARKMNMVSRRSEGLVRMTGRDFCRNVGFTGLKCELSSVSRTVRTRIRGRNFSIIESLMNRKIKISLRRSPRVPGCNPTKGKPELRRKVILTVRPVVGTNHCRIGALTSN